MPSKRGRPSEQEDIYGPGPSRSRGACHGDEGAQNHIRKKDKRVKGVEVVFDPAKHKCAHGWGAGAARGRPPARAQRALPMRPAPCALLPAWPCLPGPRAGTSSRASGSASSSGARRRKSKRRPARPCGTRSRCCLLLPATVVQPHACCVRARRQIKQKERKQRVEERAEVRRAGCSSPPLRACAQRVGAPPLLHSCLAHLHACPAQKRLQLREKLGLGENWGVSSSSSSSSEGSGESDGEREAGPHAGTWVCLLWQSRCTGMMIMPAMHACR